MPQISPLQQLIRLKEIERQLNNLPTHDSLERVKLRGDLVREREILLAMPVEPPEAIRASTDPEQWTKAFCETFGVDDAATVHAWFSQAMGAQYAQAYASAAAAGKADDLARMLELIHDALDKGLIRAQLLDLRDGNGPMRLDERIERVLRDAGYGE